MTTVAGVRDQGSSVARGHVHGRGHLVEGETSPIRTALGQPGLSGAYLRPRLRPMGRCRSNSMADTVLKLHTYELL